jgi:hypothetical protein
MNLIDELCGRWDGGGVTGRFRADVDRMTHVSPGQRDDRGRHGGREEHRLSQFGVSAKIRSTSGRNPRSSILSASSSTSTLT